MPSFGLPRFGFELRELVDVDDLALQCAIPVPRRSGLVQQHAALAPPAAGAVSCIFLADRHGYESWYLARLDRFFAITMVLGGPSVLPVPGATWLSGRPPRVVLSTELPRQGNARTANPDVLVAPVRGQDRSARRARRHQRGDLDRRARRLRRGDSRGCTGGVRCADQLSSRWSASTRSKKEAGGATPGSSA
jgi:hypothetical protein